MAKSSKTSPCLLKGKTVRGFEKSETYPFFCCFDFYNLQLIWWLPWNIAQLSSGFWTNDHSSATPEARVNLYIYIYVYIIGVSQRIFHKKLRSTFLGVAKCGKCQAFSLQSLRVLSTHVGMASDRNESYFKTTLLSQKKGDPGPRILDSQPTWCLQKLPKPATEKQRYHPITTKDAYESKPVENP